MNRGSSLPGTGRSSIDGVLDFAWRAGVFTATDAMHAAKLTRSTAIEAIDTLIGAETLRELPNARDAGEYRAGRPARRFELTHESGALLALDAGDTHLTVAVADLSGSILVRRQAAVHPSQTVPARQKAIIDLVSSVVEESTLRREQIYALCAGVAAPVTRAGKSPPHPEGFWERTNPNLIELLDDWADVVEVKNDAQLAAAAEGAEGAAVGCRDYIALLAGERLGSGVVVDGHLLHGAHGGVGEMYAADFLTGVGSAHGLGVTLENEARALISSTPGAAGLAALSPESVTAQRVLELSAEGDPLAQRAVRRVGDVLARIAGLLGSMFDPERVIVCGAIAGGIQPVVDAARETLAAQIHLPAPLLVPSELGADVVIRGALARAQESARRIALPARVATRLAAL